VIGSNTRVNSDQLTAYVGSNDVESGRMEPSTSRPIGCDSGAGVVIIEGPIGQSAQIQRLEGNQEALAACPGIQVLEQQTANWSRAEAQTLMENWLTTHGDAIKGVIGQNDEMALGAIEAIKGAGMNTSDFAIAGIDGITDALNAVKAGEMQSILQDANAQAQGALDLAIFHASGCPRTSARLRIWRSIPTCPGTAARTRNTTSRGRRDGRERGRAARHAAVTPRAGPPGRPFLFGGRLGLDFGMGAASPSSPARLGIGAAIAGHFATKGARVALVD
jgi:ABC-type sugar transport system substrate-binding protein